MESVRTGLVGLGWWGGELLRGARSAAITGTTCYSRNPETRASFAAEHGMRPVATFDEMLADADTEAVIIATPHSTHADLVRAACEAGKHVFVEKPFVMTVEDGRACLRAAERAGVVLQVGHQRRRQPANRRIRQLIDDGVLGAVVAAEANFSSPGRAGAADPDNWRQNRTERPLSGLTPLGVHAIDTFHSLLGPVARVGAMSVRPAGKSPLDDAAVLTLEFQSGAVGTLVTSTSIPTTMRLGVLGTEGAAWNDQDGHRLLVQPATDRAPTEQPVDQLDVIADELAEFARCVRTGATPEVDGRAGLQVVAVMQAALASQESHTAVPVETV